MASSSSRLQILCLHGTRQDGEVFANRIKKLRAKLRGIADLHFASAPHELPLQEGQQVAMRAWWRHWNMDDPSTNNSGDSSGSDSEGRSYASGPQQQQPPAPRGFDKARIQAMIAAGWGDAIQADWAVSLATLEAAWAANAPGGFDGVLGFSNGAAAAFLLAAHAAATPPGQPLASLKFVIMAGGYPPEPLHRLVPAAVLSDAAHCAPSSSSSAIGPHTTTTNSSSGTSSSAAAPAGDSVPVWQRLRQPLPFASLHVMGKLDAVVPPANSMELVDCFQADGRQVLLHESGHCIPQQGSQWEPIVRFVSSFAEQQDPPGSDAGSNGKARRAQDKQQRRQQQQQQQYHHHQQQQQQQPQQPRQPQQSPQPPQPQQQQQQQTLQQQPPQFQQQQAIPAHPATEEQAEEMAALEAIYGTEYFKVSDAPPRFSIHLREPGSAVDNEAGSSSAAGPPSRLFSIKFTLPQAYPAEAVPSMDIIGPLGSNDPCRTALQTHLAATAAEQLGSSCGAGFVFQLVEAAKEWIDANLPANVGERRHDGAATAGAASAASASGAGVIAGAGVGVGTQQDGSAAGQLLQHGPVLTAEGAAPWWEREEADVALIRRAIDAAAAHAPWAGWEDATASVDGPTDAAGAAGAAGTASAEAEPGQRGRWDYVVGLVGKPSAGKSTFFNAVTDPANEEDAARVAAFPFTTIAPNIGRGFAVLPDPSKHLGLSPEAPPRPAHGFAFSFNGGLSVAKAAAQLMAAGAAGARKQGATPATASVAAPMAAPASAALAAPAAAAGAQTASVACAGAAAPEQPAHSNLAPLRRLVRECGWEEDVLWRRVPVTVKDVAGLVPGAYQGRGRGNVFLNDLCDADVLIHVVDASGSTNRDGAAAEQAEGTSPADDVRWVKEEIHQWVFANVRAKWSTVQRRPSRLPELFSGYHASRALVAQALSRVGLSLDALCVEGAAALLEAWGEAELHLLVAHFLALRFPILLALNKADTDGALHHIQQVRAAFPHEPAVAMSAAAERWLCQQRRLGAVAYHDGAPVAQLLHGGASQATVSISSTVADSNGNHEHISRRSGSIDTSSTASSTGRDPAQSTTAAGTDAGDGAAVDAAGLGSASGHVADSASGDIAGSASGDVAERLDRVRVRVLEPLGGTGTLAALSCALALKPPAWVLPVADGASCVALTARVLSSGAVGGVGSGADAKARAAEGASPSVLRDCVLMRRGSTVEDVYGVLKRAPYQLLDGEFVRAECRVVRPVGGERQQEQGAAAGGVVGGGIQQQQQQQQGWRVVRKDEVLCPANCVLQIMTNKKVAWQKGVTR